MNNFVLICDTIGTCFIQVYVQTKHLHKYKFPNSLQRSSKNVDAFPQKTFPFFFTLSLKTIQNSIGRISIRRQCQKTPLMTNRNVPGFHPESPVERQPSINNAFGRTAAHGVRTTSEGSRWRRESSVALSEKCVTSWRARFFRLISVKVKSDIVSIVGS